jgi:hypothetical protein
MPPPPTSIPSDLGDPSTTVGSPFKKQRSSLPGIDSEVRRKLALDAAGGQRRESESAVSISATSSALANSIGVNASSTGRETGFGPALGEAVVKKEIKREEGAMEEEEL